MNNNDYIYHAGPSSGTARKDHKYISREWKNGRWTYTYDQPNGNVTSKGKTSGKSDGGASRAQNTASLNRRANSGSGANTERKVGNIERNINYAKRKLENWQNERKQKQAEQAEFRKWMDEHTYRKEDNLVDKGTKDTDRWLSSTTDITTGGKTYRTHNRGKLERYADNARQDWEEAKARGTEAARKEATKYDGGISIRDGHSRNLHETFRDSNDWLSSTSTFANSKQEFREHNRGAIERYADTAKEYIKDRLGYDEKAAYESASKKSGASGADVEQKRDAYVNTTLGRLEQAKNTLSAGASYIENLFKKKRK